jgi:hypothetical protein
MSKIAGGVLMLGVLAAYYLSEPLRARYAERIARRFPEWLRPRQGDDDGTTFHRDWDNVLWTVWAIAAVGLIISGIREI